MAQISAGIVVCWAVYDPANPAAIPADTEFTAFRDIKSIPDLGGSGGTIETTTFENLSNKTYISDLADTGELEFEANYTNRFIDSCSLALASQDENEYIWVGIQFPNPVGKMITFKGAIKMPLPSSTGISSAVSAVLRATSNSDLFVNDMTDAIAFE